MRHKHRVHIVFSMYFIYLWTGAIVRSAGVASGGELEISAAKVAI